MSLLGTVSLLAARATTSIYYHPSPPPASIDQLESGDVSLDRAAELKAEGDDLLAELEEALDLGEGEVREQ